jgi:hypothetical protein
MRNDESFTFRNFIDGEERARWKVTLLTCHDTVSGVVGKTSGVRGDIVTRTSSTIDTSERRNAVVER